MGLDLLVESCAKPGHEGEWRRILERRFDDEELSEAEIERFHEISIPGYERIDAPRVGHDEAADQWMIKDSGAETPEEAATILQEHEGYYVVRLVQCDGVPKYSNGGAYDGVDETSFRGAFLNDCQDVIAEDLLHQAWEHKFPEQAVAYGKALLASADAAQARPEAAKKDDAVALTDQLDIVRACGRWYIFWGERGHPILAWS